MPQSLDSCSSKRAKERGQGLVEYALLLVLVPVVAIVILSALGGSISNIFCTIQSTLTQTGTCGACAASSALSGTVPEGGVKDLSVALVEGTTVTIDIFAGPGFDATVSLLSPGGSQIAYDDDSGDGLDAQITYSVTSAGQYTIRVREFSNGGGNFQGTIQCSTD